MIRKVLIAEDHESTNISLQITLKELGIVDADYVYYCDVALERVQKAIRFNQSYDLLITDLYFEKDSCVQKIDGGEALISTVRQIQPEIKVLVFSAEGRAAIIDSLFNKQEIDGYVRKARNDARELQQAITQISANQRYFPRHLAQLLQHKNAHQFTVYDIILIKLLAGGMLQKDIPVYLAQNKIQPSGLSSLEKRLSFIKETLGFSKNEQLVAHCKDKGII